MRRRGVGGVVALGGVGFGVRVRDGREAAREEAQLLARLARGGAQKPVELLLA